MNENKPSQQDPPTSNERELLSAFFWELCGRFRESLGGYEAWLWLGSMFSYAAAPEIYEYYSSFPGLWVHGEAASGKTTMGEWTMHTWGYSVHAGLDMIKNTTAVGMQMTAENYSNQPSWMDEYRDAKVDDAKLAILRSASNRGEQAKWTADGIQRQMKTSFMVSGESTSSDPATRSRYPHVQVSAKRRIANHLDWFSKHQDYFFLFGRYLIEHRAEFVEIVMASLAEWKKTPELACINERDKLVHGVAYCAWRGMEALLGSHGPEAIAEFRKFMLAHSRAASADVASELNINVFWTDLLNAWKAEAIPDSCFRVEREYASFPPGAPQQGRWEKVTLYIHPEFTMAALQQYLTKQHAVVTLKRKDLRDQLSKQRYWKGGEHKKRFGASGATAHCWAILLDEHHLGYQPSSDEAWTQFLTRPDEGDPRTGDLYTIVDELIARADKENR